MDEKIYRGEARSPGSAEHGPAGGGHTLTLANRERIQISGVLTVDNFDDEEVTLETELGALTIRGEELHIRQFDQGSGRFEVEGVVNALQYTAPRQRTGRTNRGRGFFERLLR